MISIALGGYKHVFKACIKSHRRYAMLCGYRYFLLDRAPWKLSPCDSAWLKIRLIRDALLMGYDQVLFIDADCEVRPHAPPLFEEIIQDGKFCYAAPGKSGRFNSGFLAFLNTDEAVCFLNNLLAMADKAVPPEDDAPFENGHFIYYAKGAGWIQTIGHFEWNNNSTMNQESYVQHYSGGPLRKFHLANKLGKWPKLLGRIDNKIAGWKSPPEEFTSEHSTGKRMEIIMKFSSLAIPSPAN